MYDGELNVEIIANYNNMINGSGESIIRAGDVLLRIIFSSHSHD